MQSVLIVTLFATLGFASVINNGRTVLCTRAVITSVKLEGCETDPCTLKKGTKLPFQIEFSFHFPKTANEISVSATDASGYNLISAEKCKDFQISECPAKAGQTYTIKSTLFADAKYDKSGSVKFSWLVAPINRNEHDTKGSQCTFNTEINIAN